MTNGKWTNWTEPLDVLLGVAKRFLKKIDFSDFPKRIAYMPSYDFKIRERLLAQSVAVYMTDDVVIGDFLIKYPTAAAIYRDVYGLAFTYISDSELRYGALHDEKNFPQNELDLLEDFALYVECW